MRPRRRKSASSRIGDGPGLPQLGFWRLGLAIPGLVSLVLVVVLELLSVVVVVAVELLESSDVSSPIHPAKAAISISKINVIPCIVFVFIFIPSYALGAPNLSRREYWI